MAQQDSAPTRAPCYSLALSQCSSLWVNDKGASRSTAPGGGTQLSQPTQAPTSPYTSTNPQSDKPNISNMPHEILLNIDHSLHPTAAVCLSLTCKRLHNFFRQPTASVPGLMTTVIPPVFEVTLTPRLVLEKYLWEMLEAHMKPRLWAGHYGVEQFVEPNRYQEIRDQYWALNPQRPYSIEEASPFIRPGGEAVDIKEEVSKVIDTSLEETVLLRNEEIRLSS